MEPRWLESWNIKQFSAIRRQDDRKNLLKYVEESLPKISRKVTIFDGLSCTTSTTPGPQVKFTKKLSLKN